MAKRWVSLIGTNYTSGYPSEGGDPSSINWVANVDGRLEGCFPYVQLATLSGNPNQLDQLAGMPVYGVRWTVVAELAYNQPPAITGSDGIRQFGNASPGAFQVTARILFDLPGNDPPLRQAALAAVLPQSQITGSVGQQAGRWNNPPAGWVFDSDGEGVGLQGIAVARQITYTPRRMDAGAAAQKYEWYARATNVAEFQTDLPVGMMRAQGGTVNPNLWGGGVCSFQGMQTRASGFVRFTRLQVLISEKPNWTAQVKPLMTVGAPDNGNFTFRAFLPDGNVPMAGIRVRVKSVAGAVSFQSPNGAYATEVIATTDNAGQISLPVRADHGGFDTVEISGANEPNLSYAFDPPLQGSANVEIQQPQQPPSIPGQTVCSVIPAYPGSVGRPAHWDITPVFEWAQGANSIIEVNGDARLQFSMGDAIGVVIGLTPTRENPGDRNRVTHGFFFGADGFGSPICQIIESGRMKQQSFTYAPDSLFRIDRVGSTVSYWFQADPGADWERVYVSAATSTGMVMAGCSLYASGDRIP